MKIKRIVSFFTALSMTLMLLTGVPIGVSAADASCAHKNKEYGSPINPTCTRRGNKCFFMLCHDCGQFFVWDIDNNTIGGKISEDDVYSQPLGHDFTGNWSNDGTHHWHKCSRCDKTDDKIEHSGGTANCKSKAICEVCGGEYGEIGDHTYNTTWSASDQYHWHACMVCGSRKDTAPHSGGTATCTKKKVCVTCGEEYGYYASHNYGDYQGNDTQHWQVCSNSGCTQTNISADHTFVWKKDETSHWHECNVCGFKKDDSANHNIVVWAGREPTCKLVGYTDGLRCSECFYIKEPRVKIDKTDHTYEYQYDTAGHWGVCTVCQTEAAKTDHTWDSGTVTTEPTEEAEGVRTFECAVCHTARTESIDKFTHTHTEVTDAAVEPTCTDTGKTEGKHCSVCNKVIVEQTTIEKLGHDWDEGTVTTPPTCTEKGVKTIACTRCSVTQTEEIAANSHTETVDVAVPATCTGTGLTEGKHCSVCNTVLMAQTVIPAKGHIWNSGVVTIAPSEDSNGEKTFTCSVCGATKTETIPSLNHAHTFTHHPMADADCLNAGTVEYWSCSACGNNYSDEAGVNQITDITISAKGHTVVTDAAVEPTCITNGITEGAHCSVCNTILTAQTTIPANGHIEVNDEEVTATCTTDGKTAGTHCSVCNTVLTGQTVIPAKGHTWDNGTVTTEPTATANGVKTYTCAVCGETKTESIPALGNTVGDATEDVRDTAGTDAGLVRDNTLIENTLTPEDKVDIENGSSFEIILEVTDIRDSVSPAEVAAVSSALKSGEEVGIYVDCSLFKIKDGTERTPIYNAYGQIGITLKIPKNIYAGDRTYSIIRVHNGAAENLGGTYDRTSRELTFYTDKFSTYAIAYTASNGGTDKPTVPSTPTIPSPPTGGGTTPVLPSVPDVTPTVTETTAKKEDEVIYDEPYVEDVSSGAGAIADSEVIPEKRYAIIPIICGIAGLGILVTLLKKRMLKK